MSSSANTHGVVLVGCGHISEKHVAALASLPSTKVVGLVDPIESHSRAIADLIVKLGGERPPMFMNLAEALTAVDADLVSILTPSGLHAALAEEAIAAGKNVVIEKPLDVDLARSRSVLDKANAASSGNGSVVSVISQHHFDLSTRVVASAVDSGRFGRITSGVASLGWWRSQGYYDSGDWRGTWELDGGGATMNQGIHTVDLLLRFLGRPVEIHAHIALLAHDRVEVEDTAVATVRFESGALGLIHMTTAGYPGVTARLQVHGTLGSAVIDNDNLAFFHASDTDDSGAPIPAMGLNGRGNQAEAEIERYYASGGDRNPTNLSAHALQYLDVIDSIENSRMPEVTVENGWIVFATVRALYISATLGQSVLIDDVLAGEYDDLIVSLPVQPVSAGGTQ
ncbi:MAG: gfo/Idh/MocA family oxidoreductase [Rhodoglobus sp.]|nr:gfo/Idh/MocA family oxidoreductase [Rhodoglobus sp.]